MIIDFDGISNQTIIFNNLSINEGIKELQKELIYQFLYYNYEQLSNMEYLKKQLIVNCIQCANVSDYATIKLDSIKKININTYSFNIETLNKSQEWIIKVEEKINKFCLKTLTNLSSNSIIDVQNLVIEICPQNNLTYIKYNTKEEMEKYLITLNTKISAKYIIKNNFITVDTIKDPYVITNGEQVRLLFKQTEGINIKIMAKSLANGYKGEKIKVEYFINNNKKIIFAQILNKVEVIYAE